MAGLSGIGLVEAILGIALLGPSKTSGEVRRRLRSLPTSSRVRSPQLNRPGQSTRPRRTRPQWALPVSGVLAASVVALLLFGARGLVFSLVAAPLVVRAVTRLAARERPLDQAARSALPLILDLMAAALRSGVPIATAVTAVTSAAPPSLRVDLVRTAALLQLGASPAEAWGGLRAHRVLGAVAAVAVRSADSGIRLADGLERQAIEIRAETRLAGVARANRVAALSLLPLGLCFLPAFVCVGVAPVVIGIATEAFSTVGP